jgi:hypothetical protein
VNAVSAAVDVAGLRAELAQLSEQLQRLSEEHAAVAAERDSLLQQVRGSERLTCRTALQLHDCCDGSTCRCCVERICACVCERRSCGWVHASRV